MGSINTYYDRLEEEESSIRQAQEGITKSSPDGTLLIKSEYNRTYPPAFSDWSPLDDGIDCVLPHAASTDNEPPSREEVNAFIMKVATGSVQSSAPAADDDHSTTLDNKIYSSLLPTVSTHELSSRDREIDANIVKRLTRPGPRRRLSIFAEICPDDDDKEDQTYCVPE